jgi:hypothetical protein
MRKNKTKPVELVPKDSPLKQDLLKSEQAAIDAGLVYDPKKLEESGTYAAPSKFKGISSYYPDLPEGYYDKYEDYIDKNTLRGRQNSLEDLNSLRADYQSNWEKTGHALARVATNIIPQTLSGFSSMLDLPGYFDAEHAANNGIVNWAMDAKKTVDEDWFPIYEANPGESMQLGDYAWWMSRGSGLIESVGSFLLQGAGMGKLVSLGLKGVGTLTRSRQLVKALGATAETSKKLQQGTAGLFNAVALNQSEAVLEATQVFRDTYEEQFKKNGGDKAKAKQAASIAAATTMNINRANILLNLSSASAFITPLKYSRKIFEAPTLGKALGTVALEGGQEAVEELINLAASKAGMAAGRGKDYSLGKALEDIKSMEGLEAAFLGAIGGIAQTGGTKALEYSKYGPGSMRDEQGNRVSKVQYERDKYTEQQQVLDELKQKGVKTTDVLQDFKDQIVFQEKLKAANAKGDVAEMERLKEDMFENQALKAFRSGTTEILENLYQHEASRPVEEVGQEYIDRAKTAIKNLQELEEVYNNFEGYENSEELFFNRANKIRAERASNQIENVKKEADLQFSKDVRNIASKYSFENEKEILFKKEGEVTGKETRTEKAPLIYSTSDIENNTGDTQKNKEIYEQFLNEVKQLPSYEAVKGYNEQAEEINAVLRNNEKEFKELTSKKHQEKVKAEKAEAAKMTAMQEELKNTTDIAVAERLKNSTENAEFKKQADAKINELKIKNAQNAKEKELAVTIAKFDQKIKSTDLENLDALRQEIEQAELSRADKDNLLERVNIQAAKLNGEDTTLEEEISGGDPLSAFTQGPEEIENEVKSETESFDTTIPPDYLNPDKETSSVEEGVAETAEKLLESDQSAVTGQDEQGNLTYNFQRPEEGYNRGAFLSREFNQTEELAKVNREEITNSLDNIQLLDPDFLTAGTEVEMQVDKDYIGEKYDPTSNTREKIEWTLREAELIKKANEQGIPLNELDEYIAEVPIKVTLPGSTNSLFYVHDNAWYKEENLSGSEEQIAMDKARNFAIRKAIVTKGIVKTKIEYKSFGRLFKSFDGKAISVSEAMPDPNLILAVGKDQGFQLPGEPETLLGEGGKILPSTPQDGRVYAIVKVGPKEFIPIPLERSKVIEEHAKSIVFAIEGYLSQDSNHPIVKAIAESDLGLDITDEVGLNKYIRQFVYLFPTEAAGLEPFLIRGGQGDSKLKSKYPLIAVTPTGIEFGRPGVETGSYTKKDGTKVIQFTGVISKNWNKTTDGKLRNAQMLSKLQGVLQNMMSNADRNLLASNSKAVVILNREGETSSMKYSELVKQTHKTNILSVNTGTEEAPKWAYTIQPTILFDTSFADFKNLKPAAVAKARPKATRVMPTVTQPVSQPAVSAETIEAKQSEFNSIRLEVIKKAEELEAKGLTNEEIQSNPEFLSIRDRMDAAEAELAALKETTTAPAADSIEAKKADIKRRREEEHKKYKYDRTKPNPVDQKYDAELTALEGTATNQAEIENKKAEIEKLEKEKEQLLSTQQEGQPYTPKAVVGYTSGGWDTTDSKKTNVSLYRLEKDSKDSSSGLLYFDPELGMAFKRSLNFPDSTFKNFYDEANAFNQNANGIRTVKPAKVTRSANGNIEVIERGVIEYVSSPMKDSSLSRPSTEATTKVDTTEIDAKINKAKEELAVLEQQPTQEPVTPEAEVAEAAGKSQIELNAEEILTALGVTEEQINTVLDNILEGAIPEQELKDAGFADKQQAIDSYQRAKELFIERASQTKTITLPNGKKITINKNTKDAPDIGEDFSDIDDMIAPLSESEIASIRTEIDNLVIRGIDPATQRSLVHFIASDIIKQTLAAKNKGGKQTVKVGPIFEKHKDSFKQLAGFYQEAGLVNKAARLEAVVDQFDKLKDLVNQHMSLLTVGSVTEDVTMNDSEEALGLEKLVYTDDWAFTISSKATSSADLKKFFSSIQDRDENGEPVDNVLGLPEILPYDVAYDTLHEILANRPADYDHMLEVMELYKTKFPWIQSVIDDLEAAPEKIQNEFVSDMAKHHIDMQFVMWSRDMNGNYSLQKWSSNKSSTEQRIRAIWKSNLKGVATQSNLININENDEYVFDKTVVKDLITQANNWKKNPKEVTNDELANWLGQFGIVISDDTYDDLRKGLYSNKGRKTWEGLFLSDSGLVNILAKELEKKQDLTLADAELLNDSAIKALASLEASNSLNTFSNSFQAGGKTIYSYGNNNYLVNRMRDLTAYNSETEQFVNQSLIDKLKSISFVKDSLWLNELTSDKTIGKATRNTFSLSYLSLEALKKKWSDSQDNRKLNNLTTAEHEVTKLGFFQNKSGSVIDNVARRQVSFFYPTMSDKTTMLAINALAREFLLEDGKVSKKNFETLYDAVVTPEIKRMRDKQATNIAGYEPNYFYFIPSLNTLEIMLEDGSTMTFRDIVINKDDKLYSAEVKKAVLEELENFFNTLIERKLADWKKLGIGEAIKDDKGKVVEQFPFMDKEYMKWVAKTGKDITKVKYAAMDYVFNYLISNAESFKLFAGDPALYAKFDSRNTLEQNLKATFANIGKRLAGDIAPGIELANSVNNQYYQVFLQDKKLDSVNVKDSVQKEFFDKIIKNYSKNYSGIEGSDAQEYTTWKEHLYVLKQLGRLTDAQYNSFKTKLEAQSKGIFNSTTKLSFEELGMVMQPIKPVYVGNITSVEENADNRVYIKSSSFPLLPELTAGLQIDKIRKGLETFEETMKNKVGADGSPSFVRASFGTANKVGAVQNPIEVFDNNGNVVDNFVVKPDNTLLLSRANFRIQQDVPYKRDKSELNRGTQETKLLFADMLDVEIEDGVTGQDLMDQYNNAYQDLFLYAKDKLSRQLGLTQTVTYEENFESLLSIPEPVLFDKVAELNERLSKASPIEKVSIQQDFADEVGEDTLERVNFINKNFDKIVEQLAKAKMNFFFDEETDTNKKCD